MDIIIGDKVQVPSITSREYVVAMNGVAVSTRLPSNIFSFISGKSIAVNGEIILKLAENARGRNLQLSNSPPKPFSEDQDEKASYQIRVNLAPSEMIIGDMANGIDSTSFDKSMQMASIGMVFVSLYTMMW